nr:seven in absentia homolog 3-like [Dermacentor andersoni]
MEIQVAGQDISPEEVTAQSGWLTARFRRSECGTDNATPTGESSQATTLAAKRIASTTTVIIAFDGLDVPYQNQATLPHTVKREPFPLQNSISIQATTLKIPVCIGFTQDIYQTKTSESCETVVFTIDVADGARFGKRLRLQCCLRRNFLLVFWREHKDASKGCRLVAQLIGDPREADRFTYRVDVARGCARSLTWKDRPRSLHESVESTLATRDCLFFDGRQFVEGGKLNVECTVCSCEAT